MGEYPIISQTPEHRFFSTGLKKPAFEVEIHLSSAVLLMLVNRGKYFASILVAKAANRDENTKLQLAVQSCN